MNFAKSNLALHKAMEKEEFTRLHLKKNIMHSIIFRIDYQGLVDAEGFVKIFIENFQNAFSSYQTAFNNEVDLNLTSFEEISESLSIPVKEIERQTIHRFSTNSFGSDEALFDISKYFTVLQINCKEYQGIDPYLEFFARFCSFIYQSNPFLVIKRLGLRKVGTDRYDSIEKIFEDFEPKYFKLPFNESLFSSASRQIKDLFYTKEQIQIDYRRGFEKGFLQLANGKLEEKYQVTLDLDGVIFQSEIESLGFREKPTEILRLINDIYLFELFKMSVTTSFLENNSEYE